MPGEISSRSVSEKRCLAVLVGGGLINDSPEAIRWRTSSLSVLVRRTGRAPTPVSSALLLIPREGRDSNIIG
jgi:hypothetical protein